MFNDDVRLSEWFNIVLLRSTLTSTQYSISIFIEAFKFPYHSNSSFNLRLHTFLIDNSDKVLINLFIKRSYIIINYITGESWYL